MSSTRSATPRAAWAPPFMATLTLASLRATTSLTPSPIIATWRPRRRSAWSRRCFCSGVTRPKMRVRAAAASNSSRERASRSAPESVAKPVTSVVSAAPSGTTRMRSSAAPAPAGDSPGWRPACRAMAATVRGSSPEMTLTSMPGLAELLERRLHVRAQLVAEADDGEGAQARRQLGLVGEGHRLGRGGEEEDAVAGGGEARGVLAPVRAARLAARSRRRPRRRPRRRRAPAARGRGSGRRVAGGVSSPPAPARPGAAASSAAPSSPAAPLRRARAAGAATATGPSARAPARPAPRPGRRAARRPRPARVAGRVPGRLPGRDEAGAVGAEPRPRPRAPRARRCRAGRPPRKSRPLHLRRDENSASLDGRRRMPW